MGGNAEVNLRALGVAKNGSPLLRRNALLRLRMTA